MPLPDIAWAGRVWTLPFLTALAPSERYAGTRRRRHNNLVDRGRQTLPQLRGGRLGAMVSQRPAAATLSSTC